MPLSCSCDFDEPEFNQWSIDWLQEWDFEPFSGKKRKRCKSCGELIEKGAQCIKYKCYRFPSNRVEARIYGKDGDGYDWEEPFIPKAPIFHCEKCGEIFLNLHSVGFECLLPSENMPQALKEYHKTYAPPKLIKRNEVK